MTFRTFVCTFMGWHALVFLVGLYGWLTGKGSHDRVWARQMTDQAAAQVLEDWKTLDPTGFRIDALQDIIAQALDRARAEVWRAAAKRVLASKRFYSDEECTGTVYVLIDCIAKEFEQQAHGEDRLRRGEAL